jgi:hypothetical protein
MTAQAPPTTRGLPTTPDRLTTVGTAGTVTTTDAPTHQSDRRGPAGPRLRLFLHRDPRTADSDLGELDRRQYPIGLLGPLDQIRLGLRHLAQTPHVDSAMG